MIMVVLPPTVVVTRIEVEFSTDNGLLTTVISLLSALISYHSSLLTYYCGRYTVVLVAVECGVLKYLYLLLPTVITH